MSYFHVFLVVDGFRWTASFRQRLEDGGIKITTEAKDAAVLLWKTHSGQYDDRRGVHIPSMEGRRHRVKRFRRSDETERDYRRPDQKWLMV